MFGGIVKGAQSIGEALRLAVKVVPKNPASAADFNALANQWIADAGRLGPFNWRDPFKPSRQLWQVIKAKYGG